MYVCVFYPFEVDFCRQLELMTHPMLRHVRLQRHGVLGIPLGSKGEQPEETIDAVVTDTLAKKGCRYDRDQEKVCSPLPCRFSRRPWI